MGERWIVPDTKGRCWLLKLKHTETELDFWATYLKKNAIDDEYIFSNSKWDISK